MPPDIGSPAREFDDAIDQLEPGRTDASIQVFSALWVIAYHCLFYLDFYVTTDMESFQTPEYIRGDVSTTDVHAFAMCSRR